MITIDINQIKKLRQKTGAPIIECRGALRQAQGKFDKALEILRKKGLERAEKKAGRKTKAGIVETYIHATKTNGATVALSSETDFVAKNPEFKELAHEIAMQITAMDPKDEKELLAQPWIKDESKTIGDLIKEKIARFGENIKIEDFKRFQIGK